MGAMQTVLVIKTDGQTFSGTQSGQGQSANITDGRIEGEKIFWTNQVVTPVKMKLEYTGVIGADGGMTGKVKAGFMGSFPFTGVRST